MTRIGTRTIAALVVFAVSPCASGALITTYFIAVVPDNHNGPLQNGAEIRGRYTFESTTPDLYPGNQTYGNYEGAVTEMLVVFPFVSATSMGSNGTIAIFNDSLINNIGPYLDRFAAGTAATPVVFENPSNIFGSPRVLVNMYIELRETQENPPPSVLHSVALSRQPTAV